MSRPAKVLIGLRQNGIDFDRFWHHTAYQCSALARTDQCGHGLIKIGQCGRHAPHAQTRIQQPQPRQTQLQLHTTLAAEQLMPLINNHGMDTAQGFIGIGVTQHNRQTFRCGDQSKWRITKLTTAATAAGITGAHLNTYIGVECVSRRL